MNEIIYDNDITKMILRNKKNEIVAFILIDNEDKEKINSLKWRLVDTKVLSGQKHNIIQLSYFLLGNNIPDGYVVVHSNGDMFDYRKSNLKIITISELGISKGIQSNNVSEYNGVYYDKNRDKWGAEIKLNGSKCYLGRYDNISDAVYARYIGEITLYPEIRNTDNDENIISIIDRCWNKSFIEGYVRNRLRLKMGI